MTFATRVTARLPSTYQKLNAECDLNARIPNTASASPRWSGSSNNGMSEGEYSRSPSRTVLKVPRASASAVRSAAPFPRLRSCVSTRTCSGHEPLWRSSRVPSREPSSTTINSYDAGSFISSTAAIARSTVARSSYTGIRIERSMVRSLTSRVVPLPLAAGAVALVAATLAVVPSLRPAGWDVTALPRIASNTPLGADARRIDPGFHTVQAGAYDGQFYWAIALDPIATGSIHRDVDEPSYRYGHPLYGWLGWIFSAGQGTAAAAALLAVGLASFAAAAAAAAWLGVRRGRAGWESLFVVANAGLLYSTAHDLAEPLCAALLLGGLAAYVAGRRPAALACFALLPLAKEPLALLPIAVALWEVWRNRVRIR